MPKNVLECTILLKGSSLRGSSKSMLTVHWEMSSRGPNHPLLLVFPSSQVWLISVTWLQVAVSLDGVSLAWVVSGSPATRDLN